MFSTLCSRFAWVTKIWATKLWACLTPLDPQLPLIFFEEFVLADRSHVLNSADVLFRRRKWAHLFTHLFALQSALQLILSVYVGKGRILK